MLLITLSATGRWVLTMTRTFATKKVRYEHFMVRFVSVTRFYADGGTFFFGPLLQARFVVMATTSLESPRHAQIASLGKGAMRRTRGCLGTPLLFWHQATMIRAMLRIASPTKKTAANNAASGKNLAITNPTPRKTDENRMAVRSVPIGVG